MYVFITYADLTSNDSSSDFKARGKVSNCQNKIISVLMELLLLSMILVVWCLVVIKLSSLSSWHYDQIKQVLYYYKPLVLSSAHCQHPVGELLPAPNRKLQNSKNNHGG